MVWDLARFQVGTDTFSGTILSCFGDSAPAVLGGLDRGEFLLVLDALDEAHVRAGVQNFEAFLEDITRRLKTARSQPALVLFARSETSDLIAVALEINDVPFARLTVDFFDRKHADDFLEKRLGGRSSRFAEARDRFFGLVYQLLDVDPQQAWNQAKVRSFLGYAPVLEAIASFLNVTNYQNLLNELEEVERNADLSSSGMQWRFLGQIINTLLKRERDKVIRAVRGALEAEANRHGWKSWDDLFDGDEQCGRVLAKVLQAPLTLSMRGMPPALASRYEEALTPNLAEHVFVGEKGNFANVVFAEYSYAWALTRGTRQLRLRLRAQLGEYRPSPILGRFVVALGAESDGGVIIDGEDLGLIYESFLSQTTRQINVTIAMFGNGNEVDCIISSEERDSEEVVFRVAVSPEGVYLRRRLTHGQVYIDAAIRLGIPGSGFLLGPDVEVGCGKLTMAASALEIDVEGDVVLVAESLATESYDLRLRTFNGGKGRLRVLWPDLAYPWIQFRDDSLGRVREFDDERSRVLYKFLLMFRRQRARRMDTVRKTRWSPTQLSLRDELLGQAVRAGVLRVDHPYYVFNSEYDSLKTYFSESPNPTPAAQRFADGFLEG